MIVGGSGDFNHDRSLPQPEACVQCVFFNVRLDRFGVVTLSKEQFNQ